MGGLGTRDNKRESDGFFSLIFVHLHGSGYCLDICELSPRLRGARKRIIFCSAFTTEAELGEEEPVVVTKGWLYAVVRIH